MTFGKLDAVAVGLEAALGRALVHCPALTTPSSDQGKLLLGRKAHISGARTGHPAQITGSETRWGRSQPAGALLVFP